MITVGGGLLENGQALDFESRIADVLPFLGNKDPKLYEIKSLHLTERERGLFDRATTQSKKNSSERNELKKLGFEEAEIATYKDLIRYLPRYVETIV